jgi:hypothetical protein
VKRFLVAVGLALVLASGASGAKPKPYAPSAADKAAARALSAAADGFLTQLDGAQAQAVTQVRDDLAACSAAYATKVDTRRMTELQAFLADARAVPAIPALWRSMVARWDAVHPRDRYLRLLVATAHSQERQVMKLGAGAAQLGICDTLAAWEASGWSNSYVGDLEDAWNASIAVDPAVFDGARNRVAGLTPQLRKLGLSDEQILNLIIAVL